MPAERPRAKTEPEPSSPPRITPSSVRVPILSPGARTWVLLLGERIPPQDRGRSDSPDRKGN